MLNQNSSFKVFGILVFKLAVFFVFSTLFLDKLFEKVIERSPNIEINQFLIPKTESFDVLFVGNSRTKHHLNPNLFCKKGIKTRNLGITGGATLAENYYLLKQFLVNNKVRSLVVEYLPSNPVNLPKCFYKFKMFYGKEFLQPYFNYYIYSESFILPYFRYIFNNYNFRNLLHDIFFLSSDQKNLGFVPKNGNLQSESKVSEIKFEKPDRYYLEIKKLAKKNNIKLLYIISPLYKKKINLSKIPVDVLDFSKLYNNANLFFDDFHLNARGADLFTSHIYDKLYYDFK